MIHNSCFGVISSPLLPSNPSSSFFSPICIAAAFLLFSPSFFLPCLYPRSPKPLRWKSQLLDYIWGSRFQKKSVKCCGENYQADILLPHIVNCSWVYTIQTGDMECRPGNRIEGATGCPSWCRPLCPLFHFLDDVSCPQSVQLWSKRRSLGCVIPRPGCLWCWGNFTLPGAHLFYHLYIHHIVGHRVSSKCRREPRYGSKRKWIVTLTCMGISWESDPFSFFLPLSPSFSLAHLLGTSLSLSLSLPMLSLKWAGPRWDCSISSLTDGATGLPIFICGKTTQMNWSLWWIIEEEVEVFLMKLYE